MHSSLRWLLVATIVFRASHLTHAEIFSSKYVTKDIAQDISNGLNNLAHDLLVQLQSNNSKAEIISPLSIGSSMLLLLRTARGTTRQELLQLMGLTKYQENNPKIPRNFAHLINELLFDDATETSALDYNVPWKSQSKCEVTDYHYDSEDSEYDYDRFDSLPEDPSVNNVVKLANAIFVQDGFYNNSRLHRLVDRYYRSEVESLDFHNNPSEAKNHINKWAEKNTNGRIREIISDDLSTETTMVVANALYFKAFWEDVFLAGATKMRKFFPNGENEESVEAEIMAHGGCFPYFKSSQLDARIMGFPYKNRTSTMYIILPNSSTRVKLQQLMEQLDAPTLDGLISNMTMQTASVLFPKMHLSTSFELKSALQSLGTKSMFNRGQSNFSLLNPAKTNATRESLSVSGVLHKVDLAIDESGTEGAAVTATLLDRSMPTVNFRVIVPFLLAIRHDATKLLLFYGPVYDPTA
ncbi:serine protease inhibitor 28Dc-like [Ochlerotatus camptorhynchus]|uniref:serine protease inhibitor 28Dc-like n=1 Tax=Ochlerotatus camptorhynchus TaxID=644619 RepID=UPI0031CE5B95